VNSITTIFEGHIPRSSEKSLGSDEGNSMVNGQEIVLPMWEVSSDAILNRLQNRLGGPEVPSIHCIIGPLKVHYALCNWGASVNIMSKMVYDCLDEDPLVPVSLCLQLVDYIRVQSYGLVKDVLIEVRGSSTLVDFLVVDIGPHQQTSIILGTPFLRPIKADINERKGIISMRVIGKHEKFTFHPKNLTCLYQVWVHHQKGLNKVENVEVLPHEREHPKIERQFTKQGTEECQDTQKEAWRSQVFKAKIYIAHQECHVNRATISSRVN
jgi:hypothetical protein